MPVDWYFQTVYEKFDNPQYFELIVIFTFKKMFFFYFGDLVSNYHLH